MYEIIYTWLNIKVLSNVLSDILIFSAVVFIIFRSDKFIYSYTLYATSFIFLSAPEDPN